MLSMPLAPICRIVALARDVDAPPKPSFHNFDDDLPQRPDPAAIKTAREKLERQIHGLSVEE